MANFSKQMKSWNSLIKFIMHHVHFNNFLQIFPFDKLWKFLDVVLKNKLTSAGNYGFRNDNAERRVENISKWGKARYRGTIRKLWGKFVDLQSQ